MNELQNTVARLYSRLEELSEEYEELTDTDVREALHETLNYYFIWAKPCDHLPCNYAMFTEDGDRAVAEVVTEFLKKATALATQHGIPVGRDRLAILQDETIETPRGEQYDLFIGYVNEPLAPEPLHASRFERGDYEDE
jgi:hypothetical protein